MYNQQIVDANQNAGLRYIIKRSGKQVQYQPVKIRTALEKANIQHYAVLFQQCKPYNADDHARRHPSTKQHHYTCNDMYEAKT
jgi:hypothetical protein